jgi:hypothetical protein
MQYASAGLASILRICAVGLFIVAAIVYWGGWTPTSAAGLLSAGLACFAGSFMHVPEATAEPRNYRRETRAADEPLARERTRERERV